MVLTGPGWYHVTHFVHNDDVIPVIGLDDAARHEPAAGRSVSGGATVAVRTRWSRPPTTVRVRVEVDFLFDVDGGEKKSRVAPPSGRHCN